MRFFAALLAVLALASTATASSGGRIIAEDSVRVAIPAGWQQVASAGDGQVVDPKTLLVVKAAVRVAQVALGGKAYQINVMVGDRSAAGVVELALAVGRSFDLAH